MKVLAVWCLLGASCNALATFSDNPRHVLALRDDHNMPNMPAANGTNLDQPKPGYGSAGDEHGHGHGHVAPLLELDEAEILQHHAPDPLSYWEHDTTTTPDDPHSRHPQYGHLMAAHVITMSLAFFAVLPLGIALRSASHRFHPILQLLFYILVFLGWLFSALYSNLTPELYEHQKHSSMGYFVLVLVVAIGVVDAVVFVRRFVSFMRSSTQPTLAASLCSFCKNLVAGPPKDNRYGSYSPTNEYSNLAQEPEEYDARDQDHFHDVDLVHSPDQDDDLEKPDSQSRRPKLFRLSYNSDLSATPTLRDDASFISPHASPISLTFAPNACSFWGCLCANVVYLAEWALIVLSYTLLLSGGVVYTGMCRESYLNGCLAHLIKGSIFFLYGIFAFCRYLGAFAKFGWAWNRMPDVEDGGWKSRVHTAEMTECALIFTYGITNTWLERTGAAPGAPYTTKEIQHISIAVMFWFAGIVGMALESKRVRRLLALSAFSASSSQATIEPATYTGSFNPFPALVIGVTGAAMAAHHQVYLFAIQVHALWGNLLVAAAVLRCLTYFFLWLKPPTAELSVLPSRPPTEALAAFTLACGGLVFIASTEQIVFASMRHGRDDIMMILNIVVALTCLVFSWCVLVLAVKGWARNRAAAPISV